MSTSSLIIGVLGIFFSTLQISRADLGETREQIIVRYGKPLLEYKDTLRFRVKGAPGLVVLGADGKCVEECYDFPEALSQKQVMEILLRNSKGQAWGSVKLHSSDINAVDELWRYRQPETGWRASYREDGAAHDSVYYSLTIVHPSRADNL